MAKKKIKSQVILNPMLGQNELKKESVVMTFARMNPPHKGHGILVENMRHLAEQNKSDLILILSETFGDVNNPLMVSEKIEIVEKAFNVLVKKSKSLYTALEECARNYNKVYVVIGEDRFDELNFESLEKSLAETNSIFEFIRIERDDNSSTELRKLFSEGALDEARLMLPQPIQDDVEYIADLVWIGQSFEIDNRVDEALSVGARMQRANKMKAMRAKIEAAKDRAMRRRAVMKKIVQRARKLAINNMKKKLTKGRDLDTLSVSEKQRVEDIIRRRKEVINRAAQRLIRTVRNTETKRLENSAKNEDSIIEIMSDIFEGIS